MKTESTSAHRLARLCLSTLCLALTLLYPTGEPKAEPGAPPKGPFRIDRVAVRWHSAATGGIDRPQFVSARKLAFLARLEALVSDKNVKKGYESKHIRRALQRHITETILANLPVNPEPTAKQIGDYAEDARKVLHRQIIVHQKPKKTQLSKKDIKKLGFAYVQRAAIKEGIEGADLDAVLARRARASWYLDKTVAPMLEPSSTQLINLQRSGTTPYTSIGFDQARQALRDWYLTNQLRLALDRYYNTVRTAVKVRVLVPPGD